MPPNQLAGVLSTYKVQTRAVDANGTVVEKETPGSARISSTANPSDTAIDVDGDNKDDVVVRVNVVDAQFLTCAGSSNSRVVAPNVEIERHPDSVGRFSPSLRIVVEMALDVTPKTVVRFGYETPTGGSIPTHLNAVLKGIESIPPFNPLTAVIHSEASLLKTLGNYTGAGNFPTYRGPLNLVGSVAIDRNNSTNPPVPAARLDFNLGYMPLPDCTEFTYSRFKDTNGNSRDLINYKHKASSSINPAQRREVDVNGSLARCEVPGLSAPTTGPTSNAFDETKWCLPSSGEERLEIKARVDRLPSTIAADITTISPTAGAVDLTSNRASGDGAPPDLSLDVSSQKANGDVSVIHADVQSVPDAPGGPSGTIHGDWNLPTSGPATVTFKAPTGANVASVQARVANFTGTSTAFKAFVPERPLYFNFQSGLSPAGTREQLITARVESLRSFTYQELSGGGMDVQTDLGDGGEPLHLNISNDRRDRGKERFDANVTVDPLPKQISLKTFGSIDSVSNPLNAIYRASSQVDVNGSFEIRGKGSVKNSKCDDTAVDAETTCVRLRASHVPQSLETKVFNIPPDTAPGWTQLEIKAPSSGLEPDVFVEFRSRGSATDEPIVGHVHALGVSTFTKLRMVSRPNKTIEKLEFHPCNWQFDVSTPSCAADDQGNPTSGDRLGILRFGMRNFSKRTAMPAPTLVAPPYLVMQEQGISGATDILREVAGELKNVGEITYESTPQKVSGIRAQIGSGQDVLNLRLSSDDVDYPDDDPSNGRFTNRASISVNPLPSLIELCLRPAGEALSSSSTSALIAPCANSTPFPGVTLSSSPWSFNYDANGTSGFSVSASLTSGTDCKTATVKDDQTSATSINVSNMPSQLTGHVLTPRGQGCAAATGPTRVRYVTSGSGGPASINFSTRSSVEDSVCGDPRPDARAFCASGSIDALPSELNVLVDDKTPTTTACDVKPVNLCVILTGGSAATIKDLNVSKVLPKTDPQGNPVPGKQEAFVLSAPKLQMPAPVGGTSRLWATLELPPDEKDEPSFLVAALPKMGEIDVTFRNFTAPDPLPKDPPQRLGISAPDFAVVKRGEAFRARVHLPNLRAASFRPIKSDQATSNGSFLLPTRVISLDFDGAGTSQRAYADVLEGPSSAHLIADVNLSNVPSIISVCFATPRAAGDNRKPTGTATWCDDPDGNSADDSSEGAFQFSSAPPTAGAPSFDISSYLRLVQGGSQLVVASANIKGVPPVVRGVFPANSAGQLDMGGYLLPTVGTVDATPTSSLSPAGIGLITAEVSTFDIESLYPGVVSFIRQVNPDAMLSGAAPSGAHLQVKVLDENLHLRARFGGNDSSGNPFNRLQRVRQADTKNPNDCPDFPNAPSDYPTFPSDGKTRYMCLRGDFAPGTAAAGVDIGLDIRKGYERLALEEGGLTVLPTWFHFVLSNTHPIRADGTFRSNCPKVIPAGSDCIPPLLRVDQSAKSVVFGTLVKRKDTDLFRLSRVQVDDEPFNITSGQIPPQKWATSWGNGIRAQIVVIGDDKDTRVDLKIGARLEVPESLTIDHLRSWNSGQATEFKLRYLVKEAGQVKTSLGQLLGELVLFGESSDGRETIDVLLVTDPDDPEKGVAIPGDLHINFYLRRKTTSDRLDFVQIDGRSSSVLNLGVRFQPHRFSSFNTKVIGALRGLPAYPSGDTSMNPSFRLRAEIMLPPATPPSQSFDACRNDKTKSICADVALQEINADINMNPSGTGAARRLEMVVRHAGAANGIEVDSFDAIKGGNPRPIKLEGSILLDPLNISLKGQVQLELRSKLLAQLKFTSDSFSIRHNALRFTAKKNGSQAAEVGPVTITIRGLAGKAYLCDGFLCPPFVGFKFSPPSGLPAPLDPLGFYDCATGTEMRPFDNKVSVPTGGLANVLAWPFADGDLQVNPLALEVASWNTLVRGKFAGDFCKTDPSPLSLIRKSDTDSTLTSHPGDPIGAANTPGHEVPDAQDGTAPGPPPGQPVFSRPNLNVASNVTKKMCGEHIFNSVTIDGTLEVPESSAGLGADCPPGQEGALILSANTVTIGGYLLANSVNGTTNVAAGSNGGGGHFGVGGAGSAGAGGPQDPNGDFGLNVPTEKGFAGGGSSPGKGGGKIVIRAEKVTINGTLSANGGFGVEDCSGTGSGGGAGGGIVVAAAIVEGNGSIEAKGGGGGNGAPGGGGGGGGGVVKRISPSWNGPSPRIAGGAGGRECGKVNFTGAFGQGGKTIDNFRPQSEAFPTQAFWSTDGKVTVPFSAAFPDLPAGTGQTLLCGIHMTETEMLSASQGVQLADAFPMPNGTNFFTSECGFIAGVPANQQKTTLMGQQSTSNLLNLFNPGTGAPSINVSGLLDGYYGFWTMGVRSKNANNKDCVVGDPNDDQNDCLIELLPFRPDIVFGVDTKTPTVKFASPASNTPLNVRGASFKLEVTDDGPSGVSGIFCKTDNQSNYSPCRNGDNVLELSGNEGTRTISAYAVDNAGNQSPTVQLDLLLDLTSPSATATILAPAPAASQMGWYRGSPKVEIDGTDNPGPGASKASGIPTATSATKFFYRWDGGSEVPCTNKPCEVSTNLLEPGAHKLQFTAVDAAQNRKTFSDNPTCHSSTCIVVKVDAKAPTTELTLVGGEGGSNGWVAGDPLLVLSSIDQPAASGLVSSEYSLDGGQSFATYTEPFRIPTTKSNATVCWRSTDIAGNVETFNSATGKNCTTPKIDRFDPAVIVSVTPNAGPAGWFLGEPLVTLTASDSESEVKPGFDNQSDLCGATPPVPNPLTPSGICVSLDGSPFVPYSASLKVSEGIHTLRAFAVDVAGRRSQTLILVVMVDKSPPSSVATVFPPLPGGSGWWRAAPTFAIYSRDGDQGSGVKTIEFSLDKGGTWNPYPPAVFSLGLGPVGLSHRASDIATLTGTEVFGYYRPNQQLSDVLRIDNRPPDVIAKSAAPSDWDRVTGPSQAQMAWEFKDPSLSPNDADARNVHVRLLIFDRRGFLIKSIDGGSHSVVPGSTLSGSTPWDGKDDAGNSMTCGRFHYRVVVQDEAGNVAQSSESMLIRMGKLIAGQFVEVTC